MFTFVLNDDFNGVRLFLLNIIESMDHERCVLISFGESKLFLWDIQLWQVSLEVKSLSSSPLVFL